MINIIQILKDKDLELFNLEEKKILSNVIIEDTIVSKSGKK